MRQLHAVGTPEGEAAVALASAIDSGKSLMALPAMVKELRAVLDVLRERAQEGSVDSVTDAQAAVAEKLRLVR